MMENVDWSLAHFAKVRGAQINGGNIEAKAKMEAMVTVCG
jgi:hypothetical protein